MHRFFAAVASLWCLIACGSTFNAPFSSSSLPNSILVGDGSGKALTHTGLSNGASLSGPRNVGTQVWLVPVPAGDMLKLATNPELWPQARARVDVLSLYQLHAYHDSEFVCGTPCGPNVLRAFLDAVPGGYFRWVNEQGIELGMEAPAVKEWSCTEQLVRERNVAPSVIALDNISASGGRVSYISMDEPFAAGTAPVGRGRGGCALPASQIATMVKVYADGVHERYPEVKIGLIEPYPYLTADEIISNILELERAGVPVPYFHLDYDQPAVIRERRDARAAQSEVRRIREFCAARDIPFGIILTALDGTSNEQFATDTWAMLRNVLPIVGVTEHTIFQSWAEDPPGDLNSLKHIPDTVPESNEVSHTGQLLRMLEFMGVKPAS